MPQYLCIASNPSMPGLIKIGMTTKDAWRRVKGLQSTGVPTPFDLELSVAVENGAHSEQAAHHALRRYRVGKKREFFAVNTANAIQEILPVIGRYEIEYANPEHKVAAIERALRKKETDSIINRLRQAELAHQKIQQRKVELNSALVAKRAELQQLGARPVEKELPQAEKVFFAIVDTLQNGLLALLYGPSIVFGAIGALGLLLAFITDCGECFLVAAGSGIIYGVLRFLGGRLEDVFLNWDLQNTPRRNRHRYEWLKAKQPFEKLAREIWSLKNELQNVETEESAAAQVISKCQAELSRCVWTEGGVDSKR